MPRGYMEGPASEEAERRAEELERGIVSAELEVEQRLVPGDVIGKIVAAREVGLVAREPGEPGLGLAPHQEDMGHRVDRPGIRGVERAGFGPADILMVRTPAESPRINRL